MKFNRTLLVTTTSLILVACGGGGGGGGSPSYIKPGTTSTNSYAVGSPSLVATINPFVTGSIYSAGVNMYTADLAGNGTQAVVLAGAENHNVNLVDSTSAANYTNTKLSVFGWSNGQLVDQTSQWFSGADNVITGTFKASFGNFNGSGRQSMFIAPGTDGILQSNTVQMFINTGNSFTRYNIALPHPIDSYDSTVFTFNGLDNAIALAFPFSEVIMGSATNNFKVYSINNVSGSSIASGNFLGNGQPSFIVGQSASSTCLGCQPDSLFGFNYNAITDSVTMPFIRSLPTPLFNTAGYFNQTGGSNTVKVVKMDFDESGVDSAFILSMPNNWQNSPWRSSIQFLKNNGAGVFTDVTATTVSGYDMTKGASTNPVIIDLLNTGLPAIVLPIGGDTQILMQVSKGKYVASMANTITNFTGQVQDLLNSSPQTKGQNGAGSAVTFVQGPNNQLYLLGNVGETLNGIFVNQFYLSKISNSTIAYNAQQAITMAKTQWPWLTDTQLDTMIKATGLNFAGVPIIDVDALMAPSGTLTVANRPISGIIAGINLNGADSQVTAMDQLGRPFTANLSPTHITGWTNSFNMDTEHIDTHELTSHTEYLISGAVNTFNGVRAGSEGRNMYNTIGSPTDPSVGPTMGSIRNYTFGLSKLWTHGPWSGGVQYTTLNYSPWLALTGSWGQVNSTSNFDTTIRYSQDGFTAVLGSTYTVTELTPGLINQVSDIIGLWGETGYKHNDLGVYIGVKPVVVSGSVSANLPTGVDNVGNIQYTNKTLLLQNDTVGYVRALWSQNIGKNSFYRLSGTAMSNGGYRLMNEIRYYFE